MKKFKDMKLNTGKRLFALGLTALMMVSLIPETAFAVTTVELPTYDDDDNQKAYSEHVTGAGTANFDVILKSEQDDIAIYQVAEMLWNDETETFDDPSWTGRIRSYLASTGGGTPDYSGEVYTEPLKVGEVGQGAQVEFFKFLAEHMSDFEIRALTSPKCVMYPDGENSYIRVKDVPYGIYLAVGTTGDNTAYTPLVIKAVPEKTGPDNKWYFNKNIKASLKSAGVTINKYVWVNPEDLDNPASFNYATDEKWKEQVKGDVGEIGDDAEFFIYAGVPDYTNQGPDGEYMWENEEAQTGPLYTSRWFNIADTMADSFTIEDGTVIRVGWTEDVPSEADGGERAATYTELEEGMNKDYVKLFANESTANNTVGYRMFRPSATTNSEDDQDLLIVNVKSISGATYTVDVYSYMPARQTIRILMENKQTDLSGASTASFLDSAAITKYKDTTGNSTPSISFSPITLGSGAPLKIVSFNYGRLKELNAKKVRVAFNTKLNQNAAVGTDDNKNTATVWYMQTYSNENPQNKTSEAVVWTYALQVVKVDGNKNPLDSNYYLAGAKFKLYKYKYLYIPIDGGMTDALSTSNYQKFVFQQDVAGDTGNVPTGKVTIPATATDGTGALYSASGEEYTGDENHIYENKRLTDIFLLDKSVDTEFYFRTVKEKTCGVDGCACSGTEHYHVMVYEKADCIQKKDDGTFEKLDGDKLIESVAKESGVLITGLGPGKYAMIEVAAPAGGYNKLTEAIVFEINAYEDDMESKAGCNSELYAEDSDKVVADQENEQQMTLISGTEGVDAKYGYLYTNGVYPIIVKNFAGVTLPSTGGMGTLLFTIIGIILMLAAILVIIIKKRNQNYTSQI